MQQIQVCTLNKVLQRSMFNMRYTPHSQEMGLVDHGLLKEQVLEDNHRHVVVDFIKRDHVLLNEGKINSMLSVCSTHFKKLKMV